MPFLDINAIILTSGGQTEEVLKIKIEYLIKPLSVFEILQLEYNALEKSVIIVDNLANRRG